MKTEFLKKGIVVVKAVLSFTIGVLIAYLLKLIIA